MSNTAILGFGVTGESAARHLMRRGEAPIVLDTRRARPIGDEFVGLDVRFDVSRWPDLDVERAVVSPGLALDACLVAGARAAGVELLSDIDLFFASANAPVFGVTGTNGKSTVTAWTGHALARAGHAVGVGGNLGDAALDILRDDADFYVLELSSFQLERSQPHPFAAVCILNVSEDHLDSHGDMPAYVAAKQRIYARAQMCVHNRDDAATRPSVHSASRSFGSGLPTDEGMFGLADRDPKGEHVGRCLMRGDTVICATADLPLAGVHNEMNALAVCALLDGVVAVPDMGAALQGFDGLAHRFERVATRAGVAYINDSKATNLGATIAALEGMASDGSVLLIAGGDAKGVDLAPLADVMRGRVRLVLTIGQDGPAVVRAAAAAGIEAIACAGVAEAVATAAEYAVGGETVLLSPACSSLDMYLNYAERGELFARAVRDLAEGAR